MYMPFSLKDVVHLMNVSIVGTRARAGVFPQRSTLGARRGANIIYPSSVISTEAYIADPQKLCSQTKVQENPCVAGFRLRISATLCKKSARVK